MTATATRPFAALLTDALMTAGLSPRSIHVWHQDASSHTDGRRLHTDCWHFEVRIAEDRARYFSGCHDTGWISEAEMARWFAARVAEMRDRPGSYGRDQSGEQKQADGSWAFVEPGWSYGVSPELNAHQRRQTGRRKP